MRTVNRVGEVYNKLTIVEMLPNYKGNGKTYVKCTCDCGNERIAYTSDVVSGKIKACYDCSKKIRLNKVRKDYTNQKFGMLTVTKMLYNYGPNNDTFAECACDCGNGTIVPMKNLISGNTKSCGCLGEKTRHEIDHTIDITGQRFGNLIVVKKTDKKYSNGSTVWECKCDCGNTIYSTYSRLNDGHTLSCGCRKNSKWETLIKNYLERHNIPFDSEYRFPDCRNKNGTDMLPFDFYIKEMNLIIEYDGLHHFEPIEYWGGEERLRKTQENDAIKNKYCQDKSINLIRLNYTMKKDEILKILDEIFNL